MVPCSSLSLSGTLRTNLHYSFLSLTFFYLNIRNAVWSERQTWYCVLIKYVWRVAFIIQQAISPYKASTVNDFVKATLVKQFYVL